MNELFHVSDNPNISIFHPHVPMTQPSLPPYVWAIHRDKLPLYYFPRDCPRVAYWMKSDTTTADQDKYEITADQKMIVYIEREWMEQWKSAVLYCYEFPSNSFWCIDSNVGYYVSEESVIPRNRYVLDDLESLLRKAHVGVRFSNTLHGLCEKISHTSLAWSCIRLKNARKVENE